LLGYFADLSLIAISERLTISAIAFLDKEFNIYRRYRKDYFNRVFILLIENPFYITKNTFYVIAFIPFLSLSEKRNKNVE